MKKLILTFVVVVTLLVVGLKANLFRQMRQAPSSIPRREILASAMSKAEERDLEKLFALALLSIKTWDGTPGCLEPDGKQFKLADTIKENEGQEIEMNLDVRENSLVVYVDALRMYLVFPRLHDRGLAPPIDRQFCEKSFQDAVAAQKQYPYFEQSKKDVRGDPALTAIVALINEKYPSADYDKITREESRSYRVPVLTASPVQPYDSWRDEKKRLYGLILEVARTEAILHCRPGKPVRMTIPNFEVGDPSTYVLLEAQGIRTTVEWINFSRDVADGQYNAEPAKNLGLKDEIDPLIRLINRQQIAQVNVDCQPN